MSGGAISGASARVGLCGGAALLSGVCLLWSVGPARVLDFGAGWAFDAWLLAWLWLACELLARGPSGIRWLSWLCVPVVLVGSGLVFAHAWFFDVAIERRLTLLDLTLAGLHYFFAVSLPPRGWVSLLALYAGLAALGLTLDRFFLCAPSRRALAWTASVLALSTPLVLRAERIASPLFDSAYELWELGTRPRLVATASAPPELLAALDKSARTYGVPPARFSKVIVLVMETMTARDFERQGRALPDGTFLRREGGHFHRFERYFPNNQDSRTGMLDMLFSRVIPYEAYSDEGHAGYRHLAREASLVDRMTALSYRSAFAVSQVELEDVVKELAWDETLRLSAPQIAAARAQNKLCFTPDEYEQSCEDLALLPRVVEFLTKHERAFVYQEFIWGHAAEYNEASGKSNARYYSEYLDALLAALSERGLAEQTLIALTSDHGFRDRGRQHEPEVYRVPLLLYAPSFAEVRDRRLLSHVDFGMLLFEELTPAAERVPSNELVLIVGPTGQGHLFGVSEEGGHLLVRSKLGLDLLVAHGGGWKLPPEQVLGTFRAYRAHFDGARR